MIIPKGTTGKIQLHERNNIIKLQSLIHNQLSSPRYHNLFKYSWFKNGYTNERPEELENPIQYSFDETSTKCNIEDCTKIAIAVVTCSWCQKSLCLKHFLSNIIFVYH